MRGVVIIAVGFVAVACAPPTTSPAYTPAIAFGPCDARSVMNGVAEDEGGAECGVLEVPVDWHNVDDVNEPTLSLPVARIRANAANAEAHRGVLTFDFGGPGIPAVTRLASLDGRAGLAGEELDVVNAFDRVAMDRRGTHLDCVDRNFALALVDVPRAPGDDDEWDAVFAVERAIAAHCVDTAGEHVLAHLDIESAARDFEALRVALNEDRLHFLASSEGTRSVVAYATLFPSSTGAVVLDSPALIGNDAQRHLREQADGFERALDRFFAWCAERSVDECPLHVDGDTADDVAATFDSIVSLLDAFPIEARGVRVDGGFVLDLVVDASFAPDKMWEALGAVLGRALTTGDFAPIASLAARVDPDLDEGAFRAITAVDRPFALAEFQVRALADELAASNAPRVGPRAVRGEVGNTLWPVRAARPAMDIEQGARDAPPFLIIAGAHDGATPIAWAEELRDTLDNNSALLMYEGDGHTRAPDVECLGRAAVTQLLSWPNVAESLAAAPSTCASVDP